MTYTFMTMSEKNKVRAHSATRTLLMNSVSCVLSNSFACKLAQTASSLRRLIAIWFNQFLISGKNLQKINLKQKKNSD
jgi:hypothetical protein